MFLRVHFVRLKMKRTIDLILLGGGLLLCLHTHAEGVSVSTENAQSTATLSQLEELRDDYDRRLSRLEKRLKQTQAATRIKRANNFNPAMSLILTGGYASYKNNSTGYHLPGFLLSDEAGLDTEGFSLGESEITLGANVDQNFYGQATFSFSDDQGVTSVSTEEAFLESLALSHGLKLKVGRFFSEMGYINGKHTHAWDFSDAPLVYRALFGDQLKQDGLQLSWLLPLDRYVLMGIETGNGVQYPSAGSHSGIGDGVLFAKTGGDIGLSHSWQLGVSHWYANNIKNRASQGVNTVLFNGDSRIDALNLVYKWAPDGNPVRNNFKFQWEYFKRHEAGLLSTANTNQNSNYTGVQSGWYTQAVYQFVPQWSMGFRYDRLNADNKGNNAGFLSQVDLINSSNTPQRSSLMLNWQASEFSHIRLQYNDDRSTDNNDKQWLIKYTIVMGAHGAHTY